MLLPGVVLGALLAAALGVAALQPGAPAAAIDAVAAPSYLVQPFSVEFLREYWLHFELTSVLLLAAVVAAIAVIRSGRRSDG
jgi:NADH-quinone oxidoreductase subunit J